MQFSFSIVEIGPDQSKVTFGTMDSVAWFHMYPFPGEYTSLRADLLEKVAYTYLSTYNFLPCHLFNVFDTFCFLVAFLFTAENGIFGEKIVLKC